MFVDGTELAGSRHQKTRCSQCHAEVKPSLERPCATITAKVNCGSCHAEVVQQYAKSTHGKLVLRGDPNGPPCAECHGTHGVKGRTDPLSPTFARNVPKLCARCHREGREGRAPLHGRPAPDHRELHRVDPRQGAPRERPRRQRDVHVVPHGAQRPAGEGPRVEREPARQPDTCGRCHHGVEEKFQKSIHSDARLEVEGAAPRLRGLPLRAHDSPDRPGRLQARRHDVLRQVPQGGHRDLLRHVPREGLAARLRQDGQVQRLPRGARHPPAVEPGLPPLPRATSSPPASSATRARPAGSRATSRTRRTTTRTSTRSSSSRSGG